MPEMDGLTATRLLRLDSRFNELPIVAMTAHALVEERERCLQAGMVDHVTKPIDPDALFAALDRWARPRTPAPVPPAAPRSPVEPALPELEGIDMAGALKRVAGNTKLYRSLLEQFASKQATADVHITDALQSGDREGAERIAHTLKGIAGNLGIVEVQTAAANVEKAIRESDPSVAALIPELHRVLDPIAGRIRAALHLAPRALTAVSPFDADKAAASVARLQYYWRGTWIPPC
jgi:HPt (histidine-containing phosphotransfer) domain-containing protein